MKPIKFYSDVLECNDDDKVFDYLINHLKPSNMLWSYFVNWEKVIKNTKNIEIELNILNYLIGKEDFDKEFKMLVKRNPSIVKVIPALAVRTGKNTNKFQILVDYANKKLIYKDFDFTIEKPTDTDILGYLDFIKSTGLKDLLISKRIKNLVDYTIGVEAGLDSNARKNRGGKSMEKITGSFVKDVCDKFGFKYLEEANAAKIKSVLGYDVAVDKSSRRYDFVIDNGQELFIIETNFYGGGGSKLKSTAGEYKGLYDVLKEKYKFIWITDGYGWITTRRPLREAFNHNDYIFTLDLLEKGVLESVLNSSS